MAGSEPENPKELKKTTEEPVLKFRDYSYAATSEGQFKSKDELFASYIELRKKSLAEAQKQMSSLIKESDEKVSLMTVRDSTTGSLSLAVSDEDKLSELRLDMKQLSAPDKIWFHKQVSEVLYADLTKETLAHKKAKKKMAKLEAQLKQEKDQNKVWAT